MENKKFEKHTLLVLGAVLFCLLVISRYVIFLSGNVGHTPLIWAMTYNIMAIFGAMLGLYLSRHWGGYKSLVGRACLAFALGLFAQSFGQNVYNYFYVTQGFDITVPYPSLGDIGYMGSVIFYIYGAVLLARLAGVKVAFKSYGTKILVFLLPLLLLTASYLIFLRGYTFDWTSPVKIFLDFAYPLGQAFYISVALLTLSVSRDVLGGIMRGPIYFFLSALVIQYLSDFMFLYQANHGSFVAGGIVDCMYLFSYFMMTLSLIKLGSAFDRINNS